MVIKNVTNYTAGGTIREPAIRSCLTPEEGYRSQLIVPKGSIIELVMTSTVNAPATDFQGIAFGAETPPSPEPNYL